MQNQQQYKENRWGTFILKFMTLENFAVTSVNTCEKVQKKRKNTLLYGKQVAAAQLQ